LKYFVADDTSSPGDQQATRNAIRSMAAKAGIDVRYAGLPEKSRFIEALINEATFPPEVIRFALLADGYGGPTPGANRNAILLQTLGDLVLSVDDDSICQVSSVDEQKPDYLRFASDAELGEFWFFSDRDTALKFSRRVKRDIVAEHELWLGTTIAAGIRRMLGTGTVDLDNACHHVLHSICLRKGRVRVTMNGLVGDSGMYSTTPLQTSTSAATRMRLTSSANTYYAALSSREVVRQVLCPTISHTSPLMAGFMGLDNRELLPPFLPVERNEDGVFGHVLNRCFDHCYSTHLPWALLHAPALQRSYQPVSAATIRISDVVIACLSSWSASRSLRSHDDCLRAIGQHLVQQSSLRTDDFLEVVRAGVWNRASDVISRLELLLERFRDSPDYWRHDLARQLHGLHHAVARQEYPLPTDLRRVCQPSEVPEAMRDIVGKFGQLLYWWPTIVESVKSLAKKGVLLGQGTI
jgi:hypothetical protein